MIFWFFMIIFLMINYKVNCFSRVNHHHRYPVLLISLDGIQANIFNNYLNENLNSSFHEFLNNGFKAEYMIPSFPTVTWPNHYTLVTGLYSESHGIIDNYMYDPEIDEKVNFLGGKNAYDPKFWKQAKPIWISGKEQGLKTAASYWVGSEIVGQTPDIWIKYDSNYWETFIEDYESSDRINDLINWIDKFKLDLTLLYISQPDSYGHLYGPDSEYYLNAIKDNDQLIKNLLNKLKELKIYEHINIIITSDHGMANAKSDCKINVFDYLDKNLIDYNRSIFGIVSHIYPKYQNETSVYKSLKNIKNIDVYYKEEIPKQYYFLNNKRISPIVAIAHEGYSLLTPEKNCWKGLHGYNNTLESMRTIFLAQGPAFKSKKIMKPFENIHVYSLLCNILQIKCEKNNGSYEIFNNVLNNNQTNINPNFKFIILTLLLNFMIFVKYYF